MGEIFTKAGESFHKMADMTMMLDAKAQELNASNDNKKVSNSKYFALLYISKKQSFFKNTSSHASFHICNNFSQGMRLSNYLKSK